MSEIEVVKIYELLNEMTVEERNEVDRIVVEGKEPAENLTDAQHELIRIRMKNRAYREKAFGRMAAY